jgi:hypothetical protein
MMLPQGFDATSQSDDLIIHWGRDRHNNLPFQYIAQLTGIDFAVSAPAPAPSVLAGVKKLTWTATARVKLDKTARAFRSAKSRQGSPRTEADFIALSYPTQGGPK